MSSYLLGVGRDGTDSASLWTTGNLACGKKSVDLAILFSAIIIDLHMVSFC